MSKTAFADKVGTDKSNVTKWCKGALPSEKSLMEVANALDIEPNDVFRAPDERWLAKFFRETDESERDRALTLLAAAFPGKIEK